MVNLFNVEVQTLDFILSILDMIEHLGRLCERILIDHVEFWIMSRSTLVYCTEERKVEVVMNERTRFRDVALESKIRGPAISFMPDGDESNATRFRNKDSIK